MSLEMEDSWKDVYEQVERVLQEASTARFLTLSSEVLLTSVARNNKGFSTLFRNLETSAKKLEDISQKEFISIKESHSGTFDYFRFIMHTGQLRHGAPSPRNAFLASNEVLEMSMVLCDLCPPINSATAEKGKDLHAVPAPPMVSPIPEEPPVGLRQSSRKRQLSQRLKL